MIRKLPHQSFSYPNDGFLSGRSHRLNQFLDEYYRIITSYNGKEIERLQGRKQAGEEGEAGDQGQPK